MPDEAACEKLLPAEEIRAFDVRAGISQHFFQARKGEQPGLQDQPLEGFRQAYRNILSRIREKAEGTMGACIFHIVFRIWTMISFEIIALLPRKNASSS